MRLSVFEYTQWVPGANASGSCSTNGTSRRFEGRAVRRLLERGEVIGVGGEVGHHTRMLQRLAQGHRRPRRREAGQSAPDRVVEQQPSLRDERQRCRVAERFGDAHEPHGIVDADPPVRLPLSTALRPLRSQLDHQ
jgi:hypothetical protein